MWSSSDSRGAAGCSLLVLGLGASSRRDDAIGVHLVERLGAEAPPGVEAVALPDADALSVAQVLLEAASAALIVDCAEMGLAPGEWRLIGETDLSAGRGLGAWSTHGVGMGEALALARALGFTAPVSLFAVQPADCGVGAQLSVELRASMGELRAAVRQTAGEIANGGCQEAG